MTKNYQNIHSLKISEELLSFVNNTLFIVRDSSAIFFLPLKVYFATLAGRRN